MAHRARWWWWWKRGEGRHSGSGVLWLSIQGSGIDAARAGGRGGFRPVTADDGDRVELALQHHPVLILDIMLPQVDGYTAVVRLRGHPPTRNIPVIMITGRTEPWFPLLSADMGVVAHLQKPFSPQQLLDAVRAALGPGGP